MPKPLHLIFFFLILGVIYAEFLPTLRSEQNSIAYSKDEPFTQSELILSWLKRSSNSTATNAAVAGEQDFLSDIAIPTNLGSVAGDTTSSLSYNYIAPRTTVNPTTGYTSPSTSPVPTQDQPFIGSVIPPSGTPLFEAYAKGGYAWYDENDNVIVMMADGTLHSFLKSDGSETNWQQDRLAYDPISSANALANYLTNYNGKVVAETATWAFVKFPSGGFLKIAKSNGGQFLSQQ
ncbi:MAG: hypothetical protein WC400_00015 [Patescibacteria group bacterium]|jgi:hypothetical protein